MGFQMKTQWRENGCNQNKTSLARSRARYAVLYLFLFIFDMNGAVWAGGWQFVQEKDPITDDTKQFIYGRPSNHEKDSGPLLRVGCYQRKNGVHEMGVTLRWGTSLMPMYPDGKIDMALVSVRRDQENSFDLGWSASKTYEETYPPTAIGGGISQLGEAMLGPLAGRRPAITTWTAEKFHRTLLGAEHTVAFRANSIRGPDVTLIFNMSGYREEAVKFHRSCNPDELYKLFQDTNTATSVTSDFFRHNWKDLPEIAPYLRELATTSSLKLTSNSKISAYKPSFLEETLLIKATDPSWPDKTAELFFLAYSSNKNETKIKWLDGSSSPIHEYLSERTLKLDESKVKEYLRFFTFFVRGAEGPFLVVEDQMDSYFPRNGFQQAPEKLKAILSHIRTGTCAKRGEDYECNAHVMYSNAFFHAKFVIAAKGQIKMTDDDPKVVDLPVKIASRIK